MKYKLGEKVIHKGEIREIYDIDEGYGVLALDGDKYICPNHENNRCIEARMEDCEVIVNIPN